MDTQTIQFLKTLQETPSPAGFEQPIQALVRERLADCVDTLSTDVFGNVIGVRNPGGAPRVLITAHCDEIGLMVQYISDDGFLYFQLIGGPAPRRLDSQRVHIHTAHGPVTGAIARKRLSGEEERAGAPVPVHELWIDIGARDKADALSLVAIGDPVTLAPGFELLPNDLAVSRAFDDKIGVYIIMETMRRLQRLPLQAAVYCVSAVQEEVGSRGARSVTYDIDPEVGIAVDVIEASDYPEANKRVIGEINLGKGPVLSKGTNFNPVLSDLLLDYARKQGIPYQFVGTPMPTYTDASVIQISRRGVATSLVKMPVRYMHSPSEMISLQDAEGSVALLTGVLQSLHPGMDFRP